MKRKLLIIGVALLMLVSLLGCVRVEERVKVYADGTADASSLFAFSDSAASMFETGSLELTAEEIAAYEAQGVTHATYSEDGFTGYTLTKKGLKLEEIAKESGESEMGADLFGNYIQVDGTHVKVSFTPFDEDDIEENGSMLSMINSYGGFMRFVLELPVKPQTHNATTVSEDGKTLTWDLTKMGANEEAFAEFDLPSGTFPWWILLIVCAVAAAAVVVILLLRKKKANEPEAPAAETPAEVPIEVPETEPVTEQATVAEEATEAPSAEDADPSGGEDA